MYQEDLIHVVSVLLSLCGPEAGYLEYKEGSVEDPGGEFDEALALGWVVKESEGGPWWRINVSPKGTELVEQIFKATGVEITQ